jgi:hypothetical protein
MIRTCALHQQGEPHHYYYERGAGRPDPDPVNTETLPDTVATDVAYEGVDPVSVRGTADYIAFQVRGSEWA